MGGRVHVVNDLIRWYRYIRIRKKTDALISISHFFVVVIT